MIHLKRILNYILILLILNVILLMNILKLDLIIKSITTVVLVAYFVKYNIIPINQKAETKKLSVLIGGYELLNNVCVIFILQVLVYLYVLLSHEAGTIPRIVLIINGLVSLIAILILLWNGLIRIIATSSQVGIILKISLFFTWWIPIVNLILFWKCCHIVRREYIYEISKIELNNQRKESEICQTKYPIVLIHGTYQHDADQLKLFYHYLEDPTIDMRIVTNIQMEYIYLPQ